MKKTIAIVLFFLAACGKNSTQHSIEVPDIIQANKNRANITGIIYLYDEEGNRLTDNSGVSVSIDRSSVTTKTGADGRWQLDSIPYGTYDISYAKDGFGTGKIMGVYHAATNHTATVITKSRAMAVNSSIAIDALVITPFNPNLQQLGADGFHIDPVFKNPSAKEKYIHLFFSDNANISATNYQAETKVRSTGAPTQLDNFNLTVNWFETQGFKRGQTIYVKGYGDSFLADDYIDPISNTTIFPSLSTKPSPTVSFTLPAK